MSDLRKELTALEATQAELVKQRESINKKLTRVHNKINKIDKIIDAEAIKTMEEKGVDWAWLLKPARDFSSIELYRFFSAAVFDLGMHAAGRWHDTHQPAVSIKLTHGDNESLKKNIAGILKLSCYYKKVKGAVRFGIFDHGLSGHAVYSMTYNPTTEEVILLTTRHGRTEKKPLGKLPKAMKYIQEHHWYDGKEEEDEDEY